MNATAIIGLVLGFSGLCCHFAAGIVYHPRIQRYLEASGQSPAFFGFSTSGLQDYWKAQRLASASRQSLDFLRHYALSQVVAFALFFAGAGMVLLSML